MSYILGLDLGIASVGWAVVNLNEKEEVTSILDCGVRLFSKAETPKGESLNMARRESRLSRRSLHRKQVRKKLLKQLLAKELSLHSFDFPNDVWQLRVKALKEKLSSLEFGAILLHLIKQRGFLSTRADEVEGKVLEALQENHDLLEKYQTPAEIAFYEFLPKGKIRNSGDYTHCFNRLDLKNELHLIFQKQREFGFNLSLDFERQVENIMMWQKPSLSGDVLKMVGKCTYEDEKRIAKNTYSFEHFNWLNKLNNTKFIEDFKQRGFTQEEKVILLNQPYEKSKLTYGQVKKLLNLNNAKFTKDEKEDSKTFIEIKFYHEIRKTVEDFSVFTPEKLDLLGHILTVYKTEEDVVKQLTQHGFAEIDKLKTLSFSKFGHLSQKALTKIIPLLSEMHYVEAIAKLYDKKTAKNNTLPVINKEDITNPVVLRTLTQARKVINAIIHKHGMPAYVHIETGREVGKSYKDRKAIIARNEQNKMEREKARKDFKKQFGFEPKAKDILKLRLFDMQNGKCLYSNEQLDKSKLFDNHYVEVDHVLPLSRSFDDGFNNKALVLKKQNQNKGNKTPFEWFNQTQFEKFKENVKATKFSDYKKAKMLSEKIDEGFLSRNLNDTRYISSYLKDFIEDNLALTGKLKNKVFASNGQLTAFLRRSWELNKNRENDIHHAVDAIVVACTNRAMQQKISAFAKYQEMDIYNSEYVDRETGEICLLTFPTPFDDFKTQIEEKVGQIFISRMANRKANGRLHKDTIRSYDKEKEISYVRKAVYDLTLKDVENLKDKERHMEIYHALKQMVEKKETKLFVGDKEIKKVKIAQTQVSGFEVNNGIADNDSMLRLDVYFDNGYKIVPVYTHQINNLLRKAVKGQTEKSWIEMKPENFVFSLFKHDLIKAKFKDNEFLAYYDGFDRANGSITFIDNEKTFKKSIAKANLIEKYEVSVLGELSKIKTKAIK